MLLKIALHICPYVGRAVFENMTYELAIRIANSIFGLALVTFWKRALEIIMCNLYINAPVIYMESKYNLYYTEKKPHLGRLHSACSTGDACCKLPFGSDLYYLHVPPTLVGLFVGVLHPCNTYGHIRTGRR